VGHNLNRESLPVQLGVPDIFHQSLEYAMPKQGLIMRLAQPKPAATPSESALAPLDAIPGSEAIYQLICTDNEEPQYNTVYFVTDIESIVSDSSLYEADTKKHGDVFASLSWVVLSFINGRSPEDSTNLASRQTPSSKPPLGTAIVVNGATPQAEKEYDYHAWYDEEHGPKLSNVPGWQFMRRYGTTKVYGETETANFYGVNFYDENNGLGGPVWQESTGTEWTVRIRSQKAKPNIRRTWKVVRIAKA
jgi:hypothetical protein